MPGPSTRKFTPGKAEILPSFDLWRCRFSLNFPLLSIFLRYALKTQENQASPEASPEQEQNILRNLLLSHILKMVFVVKNDKPSYSHGMSLLSLD